MRSRSLAGALAGLALAAPAAPAAIQGPVTRLADAGGRADVLARGDGSSVAVWESGASVHFCGLAAGAGACTAGSDKTLTPAAAGGTTTSRPFVFDLSGGRIVVVRGECCPQHTYRWTSTDGGATFAAAVDFASVVPSDQGAAAGPGDAISLLGDPARYQLAAAGGSGKTTAEVTLDTASGLTGAHALSVDPATARPLAAWASPADTFFSGATTSTPGTAASWPAPGTLAGSTGVRLAGALATWVRGGRHELARWSSGAFSAPVALLDAPDDAGEAALAADPAGGAHIVYSPAGSGAVCYAYAAAGAAPGPPILLGGDSDGISGLRVSATGPGAGRVVFTTPSGTSTVPLTQTTVTPNVCGLAPSGLAIARAVGRSAVTIALDPAGQDTTWHLDYGTTTDYGASTAAATASAAAGPLGATLSIPSLTPGTTYHARLVATNATGTAATGDLVLRTPPASARVGPAQVIGFSPRCTGRRLRVELRSRAGARPVLARLRVRGRKTLRLGPKALAAQEVTLAALPRRHVAIAVTVRLADGRVLHRSRTFAHCG